MQTIAFSPDQTAATQLLPSPFDALPAVPESATTGADILTAASLRGWNTHLRPLTTGSTMLTREGVTNFATSLHVPDNFAVVQEFDGAERVVGVVGKDYQVVQNERYEELMDQLMGATGARISQAGDYYGNGKQVFFTMELPESVLIGGRDLIDHRLTIFTSHDGSMSITPVITSIRAYCANCKNAAISASAVFARIRHTNGAEDRLTNAQDRLTISFKEIETYTKQAEILINTPTTDETFFAMVKDLFPAATTKKAETMEKTRTAELRDILHGPTNANIDGTAWAAFNTITQWQQHRPSVSPQLALRSPALNNRANAALSGLLEYASKN